MKVERTNRLLTTLIGAVGLTACAMGSREETPAPVVQVTPRAAEPRRIPDPPPEAVREIAPRPGPAAPVKRKTTVYAYQDPGAPPEPEPARVAETAETESSAPQNARVEPKPVKPAAPTPRATTVARTEPKPKPAPTKPPESRVAKAEPAPRPAPKSGPKPAPTPTRVAKAEPKPRPPAVPAPTPAPTAPPKPRAEAPASPPAPPLAAPNLPPAADALARQADKQRQSGDYAGAAASLERSLRIAPRESYLWNRLARVRMEQGQTGQAGNLASRSNDLAGGNDTVKKDNWRIIAESKRRSGDMAGASEAERRAGLD